MKELFLAVDPDLAPFQQITDQFRDLIRHGELRAGDVLPTVRQLAGDLGVAPNTVARAYAELQKEGLLTSEGRRGTHVASDVPINEAPTRMQSLHDVVTRFMSSLAHRGYSDREIATVLRPFVK